MRRINPTLRATIARFRADQLTDTAAALTYYGLLALFPALIALVSIIGLVGDSTTATSAISDAIGAVGPKSAGHTFAATVRSIGMHSGAAGLALVLGLATALWSASGYVGAFMRASNAIYGSSERRSFWELRARQVGVTLVIVTLMGSLGLGLVLSGPVVDALAGPIGISSTAVAIWDVAKWPAMAIAFVIMVDVLYYASPSARVRGFRWITAGGVVAILVWAVASAAFAIYVGNFGSYDKTYGALGGLISLLIWLWITNLAILFGQELDAELTGAPRGQQFQNR